MGTINTLVSPGARGGDGRSTRGDTRGSWGLSARLFTSVVVVVTQVHTFVKALKLPPEKDGLYGM